MNILPHKSWHVYNKKNIEKVRKDEDKAKEEERAKQARVTLAESEARLAILRKRAEERRLTSEPAVKYEHVNLFQDVEKATNEERDAEEKEKNDKWERQITMYLDKDKDDAPWYAGSKSSDDKYRDKHVKKFQFKDDHKKRKRDPIDLKEDPLALVNSLLKDKDKKKKKSDHHHRSRKDTKEHRSKEHKNSSSSSSKKSSSIEALRAQRLERERQERQRVNELILGHDAPREEQQESRGYHSQFNPNETRQAKEKRYKRY
ncbi:hypothetical protein K501DRAFT_323479 [Backusella circina FSU 941]|nr:hypothetical protein K501DRAFT_323479 [Backusella circina FSU 941]